MRFIFLIVLALGLVACDEYPKAIDFSVSAEEGEDVTAIFSGCEFKSSRGYLFCRISEKSESTGIIKLHFPKVTCTRESCIRYQFFKKDGSLGYAGSIKKGETLGSLTVADLIGHNGQVSKEDAGEYQVAIEVRYLRDDKSEHAMRADGLVRIWILNPGYESLACNDPHRGWLREIRKECKAEYSTGYRTALCGAGCE